MCLDSRLQTLRISPWAHEQNHMHDIWPEAWRHLELTTDPCTPWTSSGRLLTCHFPFPLKQYLRVWLSNPKVSSKRPEIHEQTSATLLTSGLSSCVLVWLFNFDQETMIAFQSLQSLESLLPLCMALSYHMFLHSIFQLAENVDRSELLRGSKNDKKNTIIEMPWLIIEPHHPWLTVLAQRIQNLFATGITIWGRDGLHLAHVQSLACMSLQLTWGSG